MNYTVTWSPEAEQELAGIWLQADDKDDVRAASEVIDRRLRRNAVEQGESRRPGERVLIVPPLGVTFRANVRLLTAHVLHIWHVRKGRRRP